MSNWLTALFEAVTAVFSFGKKAIPPDSIREDKHEIKRERLKLAEYDKILKQSKVYLDLHPRQSVDAYVNVKFDNLAPEDIEDIRKALYELFPKRKHIKE